MDGRLRLMTGMLCFGLLACGGGPATGQEDQALPLDAGIPSQQIVEPPADDGNVRTMPKRLSEYDLPGLKMPVSLKSLEPWDITQLIEFLAHRGGMQNIVVGKGVTGMTTKLKFEDVTVGDALEVVLSINQLAYEIKGGIITIMTDAEYQQLYGASFYDGKQVKVVELKYADAARVAAMLEPLKSTIGTIVSDPITGTLILIDMPAKILEMQAIVEKADIATVSRVLPTETRTFKLQYATTDEMKEEITSLLTPEVGAVRVGRQTQTLVVTDLPHKMVEIADLIAVLDGRRKQVFIEAKIVSVNLTDECSLGIEWEHFIQGLDPRFALRSTVQPVTASLTGGVSAPAGQLSYHTITGDGQLKVVLNALQTIGDTKILSNPHVAVLSGEEATIKVVTDQPYAEASLESGTTNVVGESITFIEVGVILTVTPRVNDENMISMGISPEISTVVGTYQAFRAVPIVQKAHAETTVMIKSDETVIIAGMIRNEKSENETRVPILGRIPLLGVLFRSRANTTQAAEIIVFLTPRIITGEEPVLLLKDTKKQPKPLRTVGATGKPLKDIR